MGILYENRYPSLPPQLSGRSIPDISGTTPRFRAIRRKSAKKSNHGRVQTFQDIDTQRASTANKFLRIAKYPYSNSRINFGHTADLVRLHGEVVMSGTRGSTSECPNTRLTSVHLSASGKYCRHHGLPNHRLNGCSAGLPSPSAGN